MASVLIIDDDLLICQALQDGVRTIPCDVTYRLTLREGVAEALQGDYDVVFLDVGMPDGSGLDALTEIREKPDAPEVIIITGAGDADGAEMAIKNGAWDYLQKPFRIHDVILSVKRVSEYRENLKKVRKPAKILKREGIVGNSPQLNLCLEKLAFAADGDAHVLITGETGTGKDAFARALHANSDRAEKNFVVVDCTALPENLVESVLFGHEKGAFTGADRPSSGLIELADGGTLFLDEVCELNLPIQKKFLRVLQEKQYRPVGSKKEIESNFRLVAATNRDPGQMVAAGLFREDLLYRLRAIPIELPPLRERSSDIKALVFHHSDRICAKYGIAAKGVSPDFIEALVAYSWPGNVRELVQSLENAISRARYEPILFPIHLPSHFRIEIARASVAERSPLPAPGVAPDRPEMPLAADQEPPPYREYRDSVLAEAEKKYLDALMAFAKGSIRDACRIAGLGRTRLYTLLKKHGITRQD